MSLADICGIEDHEMAWLGHKQNEESMVVFMTVLPNKCLSTLRTRLDADGDRTLKSIGIVNVEILNQGNNCID